MNVGGITQSQINLQATLASTSSGTGDNRDYDGVHHPIACAEMILEYDEENSLACKHSKTVPDDPRTKACVIHSFAILLFELIHGMDGIIKVEPWWNE